MLKPPDFPTCGRLVCPSAGAENEWAAEIVITALDSPDMADAHISRRRAPSRRPAMTLNRVLRPGRFASIVEQQELWLTQMDILQGGPGSQAVEVVRDNESTLASEFRMEGGNVGNLVLEFADLWN